MRHTVKKNGGSRTGADTIGELTSPSGHVNSIPLDHTLQ